jgi:hypothetical protein
MGGWRRRWTAAVALVVFATGCGDKVPDYHSILTTSTTSAHNDQRQPISKYLEQQGVTGDPVAPENLTDITVTMPMPPDWHPYNNTNLWPGTQVIAKGDTYPTAMLMIFKLRGDFNVPEAIKHGSADAELSQNFTRLNASDDNFLGYPSSMIEGSYDLNGQRMHSYNRIVIPTGPQPAKQRYLIQMTVTSYADKAVTDSNDIQAIISGFKVAAK